MAAGSTYEPIATQTLGSGQASVTFSSIPQTYTDLILIMSTQANTSSQGQNAVINNDTSALYSDTMLRGNGTTADSARSTSVNSAKLSNTASPPTSGFASYISHFMNYSNTTTFKTIISRADSASAAVNAIVSLYRSTSAISTIKVEITSGNFNTGSTFTLYGIAAA